MTSYEITDGPKMLRETLCVAQSLIGNSNLNADRRTEHVNRLQRLIAECDRHRPIGPDGKHGNLHTATCDCEDMPCCDDARESVRLSEELLHTSTCENRCSVDVPIVYPLGHPGTYPCARTVGHAIEEHWIPEGYRRGTTSAPKPSGGQP